MQPEYLLTVGYLAAVGAGVGLGLSIAALMWRSIRASNMRFTDLVSDETGMALSHTKVWSNITYLIANILFLRICWSASPNDSIVTLFVAMLAIIGGSQVASKLLGTRFGVAATPGTTTRVETSKVETIKTPPVEPPASAGPDIATLPPSGTAPRGGG